MEIKNYAEEQDNSDTLNHNSPEAAKLDETCILTENEGGFGLTEGADTQSQAKLHENSGGSVNFEQILTSFLEKYEARKNKASSAETCSLKEDFYEIFPNRSLEKELENPDFRLFSQYKGENVTFGTCYRDFCTLVESIEKKAEMRVLSSLANKSASVGSISSDEPPKSDFFTKEQVLRMSNDQIKKNYDKIRESQQKW